MGILNATPDSFSDGGKFDKVDSAKQRISMMIQEGADIIDIGGESTRPGSDPVSEEEELNRVIPILKATVPEFKNATFSIDTTKYEVASQALDLGASIINDVSGLEREPRFADLAVEYDAAYVLMHAQGDPKTMQENPTYVDVVDQVMEFFDKKIKELTAKGVAKIILDPGIGFGKKLHHNLSLIAHLDKFKKFGFPVLVGASRKSMIGQILDNRPTDDRLTGTIAVHYHSLMNGADILRVHDVKEASDSIRIFEAIQSQS
ncbi:MAG: dihydropteroate synthase [Balneola sp.]|nr:MAG: dihydropteroate synthase [Balneola sp.]